MVPVFLYGQPSNNPHLTPPKSQHKKPGVTGSPGRSCGFFQALLVIRS